MDTHIQIKGLILQILLQMMMIIIISYEGDKLETTSKTFFPSQPLKTTNLEDKNLQLQFPLQATIEMTVMVMVMVMNDE